MNYKNRNKIEHKKKAKIREAKRLLKIAKRNKIKL